MTLPSPRRGWPGWYVDPEDPTRLQHWDGSRWTGTRRPRPSWTLGGEEGLLAARRHPSAGHGTGNPFGADGDPSLAEGPAHLTGDFSLAEVRPTWGLVADGRDPIGLAAHRRRRSRTLPPEPPQAGRAGLLDDANWPGHRRQMVARAVAFIAVIALAIAGAIGVRAAQPVADRGRLLNDVNWLQSANVLCTSTLPQIRMAADRQAIGTVPARPGAQLLQLAKGLDTVAGKLGGLWALPSDQKYVHNWLAEWRQYANLQRTYARASTPPINRTVAADALKQANAEEHQADVFALANNLAACLI